MAEAVGQADPDEERSHSDHPAAKQARNFFTFLASLWGVLAIVAGSLFPLAGQFVDGLALRSGFAPLGRIEPFPVTLIATLASLALVLLIYTERDAEAYTGARASAISRKRAVRSLTSALILVTAYLLFKGISVGPLSDGLYGTASSASYTLRILGWDLVASALYVGFFVSATRFFLVLAMREYMKLGSADPVVEAVCSRCGTELEGEGR